MFKKQRDKALVRFVCATGPRNQEWLPIRWRDVQGNRAVITRTMQDKKVEDGVGKTKKSIRTIVLDDRALAALDLLPRPINRDEYIFAGRNGGILNIDRWRTDHWHPALGRAGVYARTPYAMRDTFICLALQDGAPIQAVAEQTAHSIETLMDHYFKWTTGQQDALVALLNTGRSERTGQKAANAAEES